MLWHQQLLMAASLLQLLPQLRACYFNIGQSTRSMEDLAEAAPIVLSGCVLSTSAEAGTVSTKRYSAAIRVLEVLKGLPLLAAGRSNFSVVQRVVKVDGFGDPVACLSEVHPGDWLVFFLSVAYESGVTRSLAVAALQAHYSSASSAAVQLTPGNLVQVSKALGWQPWSNWTACSSSCGSRGVSHRGRSCAGPPCDYGDTRQARRCHRWPCEALQPATPRLSPGKDARNSSVSAAAATFVLAKNFSKDAALALTLHSVAAVGLKVAMTTGPVVTLTLRRSPDIAGGILTITAEVSTHSVEAAMWTRQIDNKSLSIYLAVQNGSLAFAVSCQLTGRVPLPYGIPSAAMETVTLTPAVELMSSRIVPWSAATDCIEEQLMLPPPTYWTAWSPCSSTCGEGSRTRQAACRIELSRCQLEPGLLHTDTRQCPSLPLCNPDLTSPGSRRECQCLNGGFCFQSRCLCPTSFAGDRCEIPLEVEADAAVTAVMQPTPLPPSPVQPLQPQDPPRRRSDCRRRRSRHRCRNGGVCDTVSGACRCQMGWTGASCQTAQCRPRCRNGGTCVQPNLCACPEGFSGTQCQVVDCYPPCVNGGTCVRPGKCACEPGYRGKFCHRVRCFEGLCLNGGRCLEIDGLCRCLAGFYGPRCERRNCAPELSYRKTYRPVVKRLLRPSVQPCSPGAKEFCLVTSIRRVVVFKIVLRPYFACPPA